MAHRLRIDAVQQSTSQVSHTLQTNKPNTQRPTSQYTMFSGITRTATVRSATANETIKKFCALRSGLYVNTDRITSTLPRMVLKVIAERKIAVTRASISGC